MGDDPLQRVLDRDHARHSGERVVGRRISTSHRSEVRGHAGLALVQRVAGRLAGQQEAHALHQRFALVLVLQQRPQRHAEFPEQAQPQFAARVTRRRLQPAQKSFEYGAIKPIVPA